MALLARLTKNVHGANLMMFIALVTARLMLRDFQLVHSTAVALLRMRRMILVSEIS